MCLEKGDSDNSSSRTSTALCCGASGLLILSMYGLMGYIKDDTTREGVVYVPDARYNSSGVYIKRIDEQRLSEGHDNRKKTGYW